VYVFTYLISDVGLNGVSKMIDSMVALALTPPPQSEVQSLASSAAANAGTPTADSAAGAFEEDRFVAFSVLS